MALPQDDPATRLLTEANGAAMVTATLAADSTPANAAAAAVNTALSAANQSFTLVWGAKKTTGPAAVSAGTPVYGLPAKFGSTALSGGKLSAGGVSPEPTASSVTTEGWVYAAAPNAGTNAMVAWAHGANLWVGAAGTTGYAMICLSGDTASRITTAINICDGQWHHIAHEVTRLNGTTYLKGFWVDGVQINLASPSIAKAWTTALDIGGLYGLATYDWPGSIDEIRISTGARYKASFTPATSEGVVDGRTLLLAHMTSNVMDVAIRSYPVRPVGAPGGAVRYFGPFQPTDWLTDDKWEVML